MKKAFIIIILAIIAFATFLFIYLNRWTSKQSGGVYYSTYTHMNQKIGDGKLEQNDFSYAFNMIMNWFL